jgi:hypothetical protein
MLCNLQSGNLHKLKTFAEIKNVAELPGRKENVMITFSLTP